MKQKFINYITLKGYSKNTINNYISIYDLLIKHNENFFSLNEDDIISYLANKILDKKYSKSYISQYISVINIVINDILKLDCKIKIPRPKQSVKQPDILSKEEMSLILKNISNIKHKSIIALMYSTGLRVSECCSLKITDIDTTNNFISVRKGKGDIERKVLLDGEVLILLREYFKLYRPNIYLFNGATGNEYSDRSVQQIMKKASERVGIKKRISTHSLRHSCFTQLIKDGVNIASIQRLAGHKNITTTAKYLRITDEDVLSISSPIKGLL